MAGETDATDRVRATKARVRRRIAEARERLGVQGRAAQSSEITGALLRWAPLRDLQAGSTVTAYVGVGTEPATRDLVAILDEHGLRVLLPIWRGRGDLDWAAYAGPEHLDRSAAGLFEPDGPPLGAIAVASAAVILVPALAVDRSGHRLGRGSGAYDAALALVAPDAVTCALLYAGELRDDVPAEAHDRSVSAVAMPAGVVDLARR